MLVYMIVHDRVHDSPPPVPNLSQINPFHAHPSYLKKPNISLPSTAVSSKWSPSFRLSHQTSICMSLLPIRATCPAHLFLLYLII